VRLGLQLGKSPRELSEQFTHRERLEYVMMMLGLDKFDGRSPLEKSLDRMAGLG
jgi:hypothetical protein